MKKSELVGYRTAKAEDIPFIFSTWLRVLRYGNKAFKAIPSREYYTEMHKAIEIVLKGAETVVNVACLRNDPDTILGYSVTGPLMLHWVFVKKAWRGIRIGSDLVPSNIVMVTNTTEAVNKFVEESKLSVQQMCPINLAQYLR